MKVVIHIGHGKMGSSAIQSYLASVASELEALGYHYPAHASFDEAKTGKVSSGNGPLLFDKNFCISTNTLLSSELLFRRLADRELLESIIERLGVKPHLICYTRNIFEHSFSSWGQRIKRGSLTCDYNSFVSTKYGNHLNILLWWLKISDEFDLNISVVNYSNHKEDIIENFSRLALEEHADEMINKCSPIQDKVNRSLTISEYKIQSLFNRYAKFPTSRWVSDVWVNDLPHIKSEVPLINQGVHKNTAEKLSGVVSEINTYLEPQEAIQIETYEELKSNKRARADSEGIFQFSSEQLDVLVRSLSQIIAPIDPKG